MKNFKKLAALGLTAALSLSLLAGCGGGTAGTAETPSGSSESPAAQTESAAPETETPAAGGSGEFTTLEEGKLIMVTNASFPPYEITDDNNNVIGIDPEIAQAIADKLGLELQIDNIDFDAALIAVQENRADVMLAGLTYNEDRDLVMDFTDSYATGVQVIIVREGDTTIAGTNDDLQLVDAEGNVLEDIQIGVQRGTTGENYCQGAHGVDHVTSLDNGSLAVQALLNGQVDCVVIDNGPAQSYVEATPGLEILEGAYVVEDYCAAVDQGNEALLTAVNTALNELIDDGTVQAIMDKYISAE